MDLSTTGKLRAFFIAAIVIYYFVFLLLCFRFFFFYFSVKSLILHNFHRNYSMFRNVPFKSRLADLFSVRWFEESRRTKFNAKKSEINENYLTDYPLTSPGMYK